MSRYFLSNTHVPTTHWATCYIPWSVLPNLKLGIQDDEPSRVMHRDLTHQIELDLLGELERLRGRESLGNLNSCFLHASFYLTFWLPWKQYEVGKAHVVFQEWVSAL